jgi:hypothetical protein
VRYRIPHPPTQALITQARGMKGVDSHNSTDIRYIRISRRRRILIEISDHGDKLKVRGGNPLGNEAQL